MDALLSNARARGTWEAKAVGQQRAVSSKGSAGYFEEIRAYRYGYETPFIPRLFQFEKMNGKSVLEIGVGNGIDAVEMARHGAKYTGLDVTANHLELTRQNFRHSLPEYDPRLIHGDLLETEVNRRFDVVYSFGTLHHIAHEDSYLKKIRQLLTDDGTLLFSVYSKYSFFNAYLLASWLIKHRCSVPLDHWRSHFAEASPLEEPVVIKIRPKRKVTRLVEQSGFRVESYFKRGFVQKYVPLVGKILDPDGVTLNALGRMLGWYHIFRCKKA